MWCGANMKVEEMESMVYLSITKRTENLTHLPQNPQPSWRIATGRPKICLAATNCAMAFLIGPDRRGPIKRRRCSAGNTSVTLSPVSSCRAGATSPTILLYRTSCFTEVNGCKSSSHCMFSMSSCQRSREWKISRRSKVGRGDKHELQTCASDESCQSHGLHEIHNSSNSDLREKTLSSMQVLWKPATA